MHPSLADGELSMLPSDYAPDASAITSVVTHPCHHHHVGDPIRNEQVRQKSPDKADHICRMMINNLSQAMRKLYRSTRSNERGLSDTLRILLQNLM